MTFWKVVNIAKDLNTDAVPSYNQVLPNLISDTFADFSLKINYKTLQAKWNLIKKYLMANKKLIEHS